MAFIAKHDFLRKLAAAYRGKAIFFVVQRTRAAKELAAAFQKAGVVRGVTVLSRPVNYKRSTHREDHISASRKDPEEYMIVWLHYLQELEERLVLGEPNAYEEDSRTITAPFQRLEINRRPSRRHMTRISHKELLDSIRTRHNVLYIVETRRGILTS